MIKKIIVSVLVFAMASNIFMINVNAQNNNTNEKIETYTDDLGITYETRTFITNDLIRVTTSSSIGDVDVFEYNKETKTATFNDEKFNFTVETIDEGIKLPSARDNWTPKYGATLRTTFSEIVASIGAIATVIGGVIAVCAIAGLSLPSIASVISNWAGAVGLGSLTAGVLCSGEFSYEQWRTSGPVTYPGYSYPLYMFRNQNAKVDFTVLGKNFNHSYPQVGGWFNPSRPT